MDPDTEEPSLSSSDFDAIVTPSEEWKAADTKTRLAAIREFSQALIDGLPPAVLEDDEALGVFNERLDAWRNKRIEAELPSLMESLPERMAQSWDQFQFGRSGEDVVDAMRALKRSRENPPDPEKPLTIQQQYDAEQAGPEEVLGAALREAVEIKGRMNERLPTKGMFKFQSLNSDKYWSQTSLFELASLSATAALESSVSSAPSSAAGLAGFAVGSLAGGAGGPAGAAAASGAVSYGNEFNQYFMSELFKSSDGSELTEAQVRQRLKDDTFYGKLVADAHTHAMATAGIEGAMNLVGGAAAGKILGKESAKFGLKEAGKTLAAAGAETTADIIGGAGGAAGAIGALGGDVTSEASRKEITLEGLGELQGGTNASVTIGSTIGKLLSPVKATKPGAQAPAPGAPQTPPGSPAPKPNSAYAPPPGYVPPSMKRRPHSVNDPIDIEADVSRVPADSRSIPGGQQPRLPGGTPVNPSALPAPAPAQEEEVEPDPEDALRTAALDALNDAGMELFVPSDGRDLTPGTAVHIAPKTAKAIGFPVVPGSTGLMAQVTRSNPDGTVEVLNNGKRRVLSPSDFSGENVVVVGAIADPEFADEIVEEPDAQSDAFKAVSPDEVAETDEEAAAAQSKAAASRKPPATSKAKKSGPIPAASPEPNPEPNQSVTQDEETNQGNQSPLVEQPQHTAPAPVASPAPQPAVKIPEADPSVAAPIAPKRQVNPGIRKINARRRGQAEAFKDSPIIQAIRQKGFIKSKTTAKAQTGKVHGEYDATPKFQPQEATLLFDKELGQNPADMAHSIFYDEDTAGLLSAPTAEALWDAVAQAQRDSVAAGTREAEEDARLLRMEQWDLAANKEGKATVRGGDLAVGDKIKVGGRELRVGNVFEDGSLVLEGAEEYYGNPVVGENETITIDRAVFKAPSVESFTPEEMAADTARRARAAKAKAKAKKSHALLKGAKPVSKKPPGGKKMGSYAGVNSIIPEQIQNSLQTAIALMDGMQEAGFQDVSKAIRQLTGWFVGPDGKLRYEIPDNNFTVTLPEIGGIQVPGSYPFKSIVSHPELLAAYPEIANTTVEVFHSVKADASISRDGKVIRIATGQRSVTTRRMMIHEIQHWIQIHEGFAMGGTKDDFIRTIQPLFTAEEEQAVFELEELNDTSPGGLTAQEADLLRRFYEAGRDRAAYLKYRDIAGEWEARDIEARLLMDELERHMTDPYSSEAIPDGGLLFFEPGGAINSSPGFDNEHEQITLDDLIDALRQDGDINPANEADALILEIQASPAMRSVMDAVEVRPASTPFFSVDADGTPVIGLPMGPDATANPSAIKEEVVHAVIAPQLEANPALRKEVASARKDSIATLPKALASAVKVFAARPDASNDFKGRLQSRSAESVSERIAQALSPNGTSPSAVREVASNIDAVAGTYGMSDDEAANLIYSLLSDHEFAANVMSDPAVQSFAQDIQSGGRSVWERIMAVLRRLFGIAGGKKMQTAFDRTVAAARSAVRSRTAAAADHRGREILSRDGITLNSSKAKAPNPTTHPARHAAWRARWEGRVRNAAIMATTTLTTHRLYGRTPVVTRRINETVAACRSIISQIPTLTDKELQDFTDVVADYFRTGDDKHLTRLAWKIEVLNLNRKVESSNRAAGFRKPEDYGLLTTGYDKEDLSPVGNLLQNLIATAPALTTMLRTRKHRDVILGQLLNKWLVDGVHATNRENIRYEQMRDALGVSSGIMRSNGTLAIDINEQIDLLVAQLTAQFPREVDGLPVDVATQRRYMLDTIEQDARAFELEAAGIRRKGNQEISGAKARLFEANVAHIERVAARLREVQRMCVAMGPNAQPAAMVTAIDSILTPRTAAFLKGIRAYFGTKADEINYQMALVHGVPFASYHNYIPRPNRAKESARGQIDLATDNKSFAAPAMALASPIRSRAGSTYLRFGYDPENRTPVADPFEAIDAAAHRTINDFNTYKDRNLIGAVVQGERFAAVVGPENAARLQKILNAQQSSFVGEANDKTGQLANTLNLLNALKTLKVLGSIKQLGQVFGAYLDYFAQMAASSIRNPAEAAMRIRVLSEEALSGSAEIGPGQAVHAYGPERQAFMEKRGTKIEERVGLAGRTDAIQVLNAGGARGVGFEADANRFIRNQMKWMGKYSGIGLQDRFSAVQLFFAEIRTELFKAGMNWENPDWTWLASDDEQAMRIVQEAERRLEYNINSSSLVEKAQILRNHGALSALARLVLFPLSSHKLNQVSRVIEAVKTLKKMNRIGASQADIDDAVGQLAGAITQSAVWSVYTAWWSFLVITAFGHLLTGGEKDPERKRKKREAVAKSVRTSAGIIIDPKTLKPTAVEPSWLLARMSQDALAWSFPFLWGNEIGSTVGNELIDAGFPILDQGASLVGVGHHAHKSYLEGRGADRSLTPEQRQAARDELKNLGEIRKLAVRVGPETGIMAADFLVELGDAGVSTVEGIIDNGVDIGDFDQWIGMALTPIEGDRFVRLKDKLDKIK
jgi:hypothetical protein